jgi:hypothetical protein
VGSFEGGLEEEIGRPDVIAVLFLKELSLIKTPSLVNFTIDTLQ